MGRSGRRSQRGSGKTKQPVHAQPLLAEDNPQQQPLARRKRKKKHTRSADAAIKRARDQIAKGLSRLAQGQVDPAASVAASTAQSTDSEQSPEGARGESEASGSEEPPDWGEGVELISTGGDPTTEQSGKTVVEGARLDHPSTG